MSDFLEQYVEEAHENVEELVNGLLRLESDDTSPDDTSHVVAELFRFAHNLKGMSGAMGFDGITEIAHKAEDLLDVYRQGGGRPSGDQVDVMLAAADAMVSMIDAAAAGTSPPAPAELVALLVAHRLDRPGDGVWSNADAPGSSTADDPPSPDRHLSGAPDGAPSEVEPSAAPAPSASAGDDGPGTPAGNIRLEVRLEPGAQLPGARSAIVLRLIGERTAVVATNPARDAIEAGKATSFVVEVSADADVDALAEAAATVTDVASVRRVTEPAPPPAQGAAASTGHAPAPGGASEARGGAPRATVRVEVDRLDDLMDLVSELVVGRGLLGEHVARVADHGLAEGLASVHRTISDLQAMVAKVRMISLEKSFARLTRIVRDTARDVDKLVQFETSGEDTELDRSMVDEVADPLMHLLRNSVDHGIEDAETRRGAGKPAAGQVALRAYSEGNQVVIEVTDDGGGIDVDRVTAKAVASGVIGAEEAKALSDEERVDLIFAPGLSTRDAASKISGRGVGMDVVRTAVSKLGGVVAAETRRGEGSRFTIRLPLSLAVAEALLVKVCGETWAIPIDQVEETLVVTEEHCSTVRGRTVMDLRGQIVTVVGGRGLMYGVSSPGGSRPGVVFRHKSRHIIMTVDELVGRAEVVVKPLPGDLTGVDLASSVTILGDGSVGLILDVAAAVDSVARQAGAEEAGRR